MLKNIILAKFNSEMWSELRKSVSSIFEERITSPFYGSFIFSWAVWNWKIIYLTIFVSERSISPINKIDYIVKYYDNWWILIVGPLVSAVILVSAVPWLSNRLFKIYLYYEKERTIWREESDSGRRLTIERSAQILSDMAEQEIKHQKQIELKEDEIRISKSQIDGLTQDKVKLQEQLIEMDQNGKKFKILYARYGKNEIYSDVTTIVSDLIISENKFLVKNDILGVDPLYGAHKELFIVYNKQNSIEVLTAKEYYEVELINELLTASETEESKTIYTNEPEPLEFNSLESFFPGLWTLSFKGKLTGKEEVEIKEGNKYYAKRHGQSLFTHAFDLKDISIDLEGKKIEFTKVATSPNGRVIKCSLNIVVAGKHYAGVEEDGEIQVSYSKIE